jgi:hypothetical protein
VEVNSLYLIRERSSMIPKHSANHISRNLRAMVRILVQAPESCADQFQRGFLRQQDVCAQSFFFEVSCIVALTHSSFPNSIFDTNESCECLSHTSTATWVSLCSFFREICFLTSAGLLFPLRKYLSNECATRKCS